MRWGVGWLGYNLSACRYESTLKKRCYLAFLFSLWRMIVNVFETSCTIAIHKKSRWLNKWYQDVHLQVTRVCASEKAEGWTSRVHELAEHSTNSFDLGTHSVASCRRKDVPGLSNWNAGGKVRCGSRAPPLSLLLHFSELINERPLLWGFLCARHHRG